MIRTSIVALCLALPAAALGEPPRARHEARQDRQALHDDLRDAQQAEWLLHEFERARAARDGRALTQVERWTREALEREVREAQDESGDAARELARDDRTLRHERRERVEDARRGLPPGPGDRREAAEAWHEREDDRRDLMREEEYRRRVTEIRDEWVRLPRWADRRTMDRKHDLLQELVRLARFEIRSDADELREDRREDRPGDRRDDRREGWRDDRP